MIAFSGVRSSCDMLARNSRLVLARGLELPVEAIELVVHPVDVRRQSSQLVAVADIDVAGEVARGDRRQPGVDALNGPDHRPGEDEPEQQGKGDRSCGHADEQVPLARVGTRVLRDELVGLAVVRAGELHGDLVEVSGEPERLVPQGSLLVVRGSVVGGLDDLGDDRDQPPALRTDVAQIALVLGGGIELLSLSALVSGPIRATAFPTARSIATELVPRPSGSSRPGLTSKKAGPGFSTSSRRMCLVSLSSLP